METLHQLLAAVQDSDRFYKARVPRNIYNNLSERFSARPYQQEALGRFVYYWEEYRVHENGLGTHLLYHMATGSGKTLIMSGLIIYLYSKGYRNFLFFVNSSNIIDKTKDNFLNRHSSKYLFAGTIHTGDRQIGIKEAENFQDTPDNDITIAFSTIQGLHSQLNTPRENSLTYEDFENKKIVLISDEAHHINSDTKKGKLLFSDEIFSWEGTVNRIFKANKENILLEFTATADLFQPDIAQKYSNKLIYDYPLKQFRRDGYSKEVKVLQADQPVFQRALQAVLLSQYRKKLFEKHGKQIKPVILFKSRTIKESQQFFNTFIAGIRNITATDLEKIWTDKTSDPLSNAFQYFDSINISPENLAIELKEDFSEDKLISVNSREESELKQIAINTLEDEDNYFRAVFAVDKLNEGWDVLNLFDIVRLYDKKDTARGKPGKTTMSEAQLIGRGARYCPFQITREQHYAARKFDADPGNELKICEELWYHSIYDPLYIRELNTALEKTGIKANSTEKKARETKTQAAPKDITVFLKRAINYTYTVNLYTGKTNAGALFNLNEIATGENSYGEHQLAAIHPLIMRKAMNSLAFYQFSNIKKLFPGIGSAYEFAYSGKYLGTVRFRTVLLPESQGVLTPDQRLKAVITVLQKIAENLLF